MRSKSIILLVLALGCGLVASIGISQVMDARNRGPAEVGDKQPVFVAMVEINPNEELTAQNIKLEEWPKNLIPSGALTKLEDVEGKRSRTKLYAGETILASKLLGAGDLIGAAIQIPNGYRVANVKVDAVTGSSNLILPGDRVDVLVHRNTNSDLSAPAAKIVLQDVRVFAVDTHTEHEAKAKGEQSEAIMAKTISLLVTPEQAVLLHMAQEVSGTVRLVLRNPEDDTHVNIAAATLSDIFGTELRADRKDELSGKDKDKEKSDLSSWLNQQKNPAPPAAPPAPAASNRTMIVMLGSTIQTIDIPTSGELPTNQVQNEPPAASPPPGSELTGNEGDYPEIPSEEPNEEN